MVLWTLNTPCGKLPPCAHNATILHGAVNTGLSTTQAVFPSMLSGKPIMCHAAVASIAPTCCMALTRPVKGTFIGANAASRTLHPVVRGRWQLSIFFTFSPFWNQSLLPAAPLVAALPTVAAMFQLTGPCRHKAYGDSAMLVYPPVGWGKKATEIDGFARVVLIA